MKRNLIIHANCQGEALLPILQSHADFSQRFDCRLFTNYTRDPVPATALAECSVFLYQYLGPDWGELGSARLIEQLDKSCLHLCIPNYFCRLYWPLQFSPGEHVLRDKLLEDLWKRKLTRRDYVRLATRPSLLRCYDVQGIVEKSLAHERAKEKHTPIKYLEKMLAEYTEKRLFYTVNHPGEELLLFTANEILRRLDFSPLLPEKLSHSLPPLDDYYSALELPVHPALAEMYNLSWASPETTYAVYGYRLTYAQFAWLYAEYRSSGICSFIEFMGKFNSNGCQNNNTQSSMHSPPKVFPPLVD